CVCFRANALQIPFRPDNGMTVIAHGSVQVYGQQGRYQLYVDRLEPSGVGALALGIEQLKQQLSAEGLFDERRKRALPLLPQRVVVVTSRNGAALRDVCTVIARRAPCIGVVLSPATVQGEGAVETLGRALQRADRGRPPLARSDRHVCPWSPASDMKQTPRSRTSPPIAAGRRRRLRRSWLLRA